MNTKHRILFVGIVVLILVSISVVGALWSRQQLASAIPSIMALSPGDIKELPHGVFAFGPSPVAKYRGLIKKNLLFPFGTWAVTLGGEIVWLSNSELELLKRLN